MTDRYTTAGYVIIGATAGIAITLLTIVALNRHEPWAEDLAYAVGVGVLAAVAITVALAIASIVTEHRRHG